LDTSKLAGFKTGPTGGKNGNIVFRRYICDIYEIANSVTLCYRLKNDFRIQIQKLMVDLCLSI
jgi:hypothetical protein